MPVLIKRPNGKETPLINGEYLSAYYFIPKEMLEKCGHELNSISRVPMKAIYDKKSREIIESDLFLLLIIDAFSWLAWPHMGLNKRKEIYSGYDPAWKLSHNPTFWVQELIDRKYIPDTVSFLQIPWEEGVSYMSMEEAAGIMSDIVPDVMDKHNMYEVIETAKEFRCFKDFDYRDSTEKIDFYRKWYHSRSKKVGVMASLEQLKKYDEDTVLEVEDKSTGYEDMFLGEDYYQRFIVRLSEKDKVILDFRMKGLTYEEIAKELGYKTHSAVLKRMRVIQKEFLEYQKQ